MLRQTLIILFIVGNTGVQAIENYPVGARSLGLSHAFVSFSDTWSTFHNQAGLANLPFFSAGVFYESKFMVDELSLVAGSLILPTTSGIFGFSFFQFGKGAFKENKFGLAFSKKLTQKLNAGLQIDYFAQTFPENERARGLATFEGGILCLLSEKLHLGVHIFNPIFAGIQAPSGKQKILPVIRTGGHYRFSEMALLSLEAQKDTETPVLIKSGIEISPLENLALRFGVSGKPFKYTAGLGCKTGKITTDIGFSYHGNLGVTPSVSVQFAL